MKKLFLLLLLTSPAFAQVSPQIQGAGAPTNPCINGGQQYVDQTNHVIYNCPSNGSNWVNVGLGNLTSPFTVSACRITADIPLPVNTATTVCTFTLAATQAYAWQCEIPWVISAGTGTNTLAIVVNASQAPTGTTNGFGEILTTNTATATEATTAISSSGATTLITSGTITPAATVFSARSSGVVLGAGGTFSIQMTAAGTSATAAAKAGSTCILY